MQNYDFKYHVNRVRLEKVISESMLCLRLKGFPSEYRFILSKRTFMKVFFLKH